jgi:pimeloyl-ACP methyl ester carboxylesterase
VPNNAETVRQLILKVTSWLVSPPFHLMNDNVHLGEKIDKRRAVVKLTNTNRRASEGVRMASDSSTSFPEFDLERFARMAAVLTRPAVEFGRLMVDPIFWGWGVRRGDGHSIIVLPGFGGGDDYLQPLHSWLYRIGYKPVASGLDVNPGWSSELVEGLGELVEDEFRRSESTVTIIGHSLGGMYGYAIAARQPQMIRQVVTLASPLRRIVGRLPASVPITAFYSRSDPIVRHPAALARDPHARNIEVANSHTGIASHPEVYRGLGSLLQQGRDRKQRAN